MGYNTHKVAACWCVILFLLSARVKAEKEEVEEELEKHDAQDGDEQQKTQSQDQVAILKQINRVNDDGSYTFGYEAADGSFKIETRDVLGNVKGMFGFIDESGQLKRVSYSASNQTGFQSTGNLATTPKTNEDDGTSSRLPPPTPPLLYQQIIRPVQVPTTSAAAQQTTERPVFKSVVHTTPTARALFDAVGPRRPVLLYAQALTPTEPTTRAAVIQSIPKTRRTQEIEHSAQKPIVPTTRKPLLQLYGQYIRQHPGIPGGQPVKQIFVTPAPVEETEDFTEATTTRITGAVYNPYTREVSNKQRETEYPSASEHQQLPRRLVLARKPSEVVKAEGSSRTLSSDDYNLKQASKAKIEDRRTAKGNALRRQLNPERNFNYPQGIPLPPQVLRGRQTGTDDAGDVYGGSLGTSPRPIPATPFRSLFVPMQPRALQSAILQNQILQGIAGFDSKRRPNSYPQQDYDPRVPAVPIPARDNEAVKVPLGVIRDGILDPRLPPSAQPGDQRYLYTGLSQNPEDLRQQLIQFLLGRQQQSLPPSNYLGGLQYNQPNPAAALTPFQLALMATLGANIPPELADNLYAQQPLGQRPAQYPRQRYNPYVPQRNYYAPPAGIAYPPEQASVYPQQGPYNQQPYDDQYPVTYPANYPYQNQVPYHIRRRLRYRPQLGYQQPLPVYTQGYSGGPITSQYYPPEQQLQPAPYAPQNQGPVGYPQDVLPDEYRDALILRMLLAVRAAQQGGLVATNPNIQQRANVEATTSASTTARPRTLAPVRSVQILDPVTEESTAKRSTTYNTNTTTATSNTHEKSA